MKVDGVKVKGAGQYIQNSLSGRSALRRPNERACSEMSFRGDVDGRTGTRSNITYEYGGNQIVVLKRLPVADSLG